MAKYFQTQILFSTGVVTSPNYPGSYGNNLDTTDTIKVEEGQVISLHFDAFELNDYDDCDDYDHLTITNGDGKTLMEKTCGINLPGDLISNSNIVNLEFFTDDYYDAEGAGWSVSWSAVTPGECHQQYVWIIS